LGQKTDILRQKTDIMTVKAEDSNRKIDGLNRKADELTKKTDGLSKKTDTLNQSLNQKTEDLGKKTDGLTQKTEDARKRTGLIIDTQLFSSVIENCEWLKDKSFAPGGWAMDSAALYTLFRILNDIKPKNVLEFGLGQSSKMVHQYASFFKSTKALTIEQDDNWIDFFSNGLNKSININVKQVDKKTVNYNGFETLSYNGIDEVLGNFKYDLVIVDGPVGSEHYSRSQIIDVSKNNLCEQFCIFMDDSQRNGEKETIKEICSVLTAKKIEYLTKEYFGEKSHTLICSGDLNFLSTLRQIYR